MRVNQWLSRALMAALIMLIAWFNPLSGVVNTFTDKVVQSPSAVSPNIFVVGIDEKTLAALGPFQSWSRDGLAQMIEVMCSDAELKPAVIALDIGFYGESSNAGADARLAAAAQKAGNVIVGSNITFGTTLVNTEQGEKVLKTGIVAYETPYPALGEHVKHGFTNVYLDSDGLVRRSLHQVDVDGVTNYSFAYQIFKAYTGEERTPPLNSSNEWLLRYTGEPGAYYGEAGAGYSFIDVLDFYDFYGNFFKDSIVIIGAYATGLMDNYQTPIAPGETMYGAEIHANIIEALAKRDFITETGRWAELCALLIMLILVCASAVWLDFKLAGAVCVSLIAGMFGLSRLLFANNILISPFYPMLGAALMYIFLAFQKYLQEARARRRMMDLLSRYLSPQVARTLAGGKNKLPLTGEKRDVAVLFVDIRGFTTISESLPPEKVVEFLNKYLGLTAKSIFDNDGTVDKFIGDATMGLFNAPVDLDDYVFRAVKAGLDMVNGAKQMEAEFKLEGGARVGFGVGVHCGEAVVGSIGPSFRMDYTAIGDTVNTASRLEGQAKPGELIISKAVYERLQGRIDAECLGERQLKGKAAGFVVYKVNGLI